MSYNISKELFETVMNIKINKLQVDDFNYIWINIDSAHFSRFDSINNFFFLCKKWSIGQKYYIWSFEGKDGAGYATPEEMSFSGNMNFQLNADSEQQAVFDVCQWILDNKGNK